MGVEIYELLEVDDSLLVSVNRLLGQLSSSPVVFGMEQLEALVSSSASHLFIAKCDGEVAGMLTLGEYLAPTGRKMWIEDVVVDEAARGRSIGRMLVEYAISFSRKLGGGALMLTSRPARVAANQLYRSCGFELKETNLYRMPIDGEV